MYIKLTLESLENYFTGGQTMSYFYSIVSIAIVSSSLFAMDKQVDNTVAKSYHMEPKLSSLTHFEDNRRFEVTYTYSDGSKSTYFQYPNSSNQEK